MRAAAWRKLAACLPEAQASSWLEPLLQRNAECAYLQQWGSPVSQTAFRAQLPLTEYEQLKPWIERIAAGEQSLLFSGRPVAFEKTGGSSGGCKLIPYTAYGLADFRRALLPWLADVVARHGISGSAYFSLSPACREPENLAGIPVGLSDMAYVGETAAAVFAQVCAVPPGVGELVDHEEWRVQTLHYLKQARDLELISAWSPTFLLKLFDGEATEQHWPRLKVISCWTGGAWAEFADAIQRLFPHALIEPKGLMSTETVVTIPDSSGQPVLTDSGFFEFRSGDKLLLASELERGREYEVVATTASGLYRYCTGDIVRFSGRNHADRAILHFVGRQGLVSDLVGEKLTDSFVAICLDDVVGFRMLVPNAAGDGYVLVVDQEQSMMQVESIETKLKANPQYAYARKLGQLQPLVLLPTRKPWAVYERHQAE
ncbi:MAG: GH3 auxin-responsive promoter family protein [Methylococcaceae bacterium]|nr:GH3 auxin-responsive promoter family protein [Methylococcaceae bacterium]